MSAETIIELNSLSVKHNCTYNNQPSISRLLSQIGNGTLTIQATGIQKNNKNQLPLLSLQVIAPFNLSGVMAVVSSKIRDYRGNIYSIKAEALDNDLGNLKILLSLNPTKKATDEISKEEIKKIINLLNDLKNLKFSEIKEFNQDYQLIKAYKLLISLNKALDTGLSTSEIFDYLNKQNLILECRCTIGIRILAKSRIGTMADITEVVAKKKVFISKIDHQYDGEQDDDIFCLYLEMRLNREPAEEIQEVSEILNLICDIEDVKKIDRLGLDTWI